MTRLVSTQRLPEVRRSRFGVVEPVQLLPEEVRTAVALLVCYHSVAEAYSPAQASQATIVHYCVEACSDYC